MSLQREEHSDKGVIYRHVSESIDDDDDEENNVGN